MSHKIIFFVLLLSCIIFCIGLYKIIDKIIKIRKFVKFRKNILEKKEPSSITEAKYYEQTIENRNTPIIAGLGKFLLLKYYKNNSGGNLDLISKGIEFGETIRKEFKTFAFYEESMFILGNMYFSDIFEFNEAGSVYKELIKNKRNTKWKNICSDRIELIKDNILNKEALKLYIIAEKHFEGSRFDEAELYLNKVVDKYPDINIAASALYFLGDINYYKYDDLYNALKYYRMTVDKFPRHSHAPKALYKMGEILMKKAKWEEAIDAYHRYINNYRSVSYIDDAYFYIGECYRELGKLRDAKNAFSLVLGDYPESKWTEVLYKRVQDINKILKDL